MRIESESYNFSDTSICKSLENIICIRLPVSHCPINSKITKRSKLLLQSLSLRFRYTVKWRTSAYQLIGLAAFWRTPFGDHPGDRLLEEWWPKANDLAISGGALLLGGIGQRVGLDDVTVERGSNDQTEVVLGKALSPRLYVSYGISIAEAINTIKLRYTINENWSGIIEAGLNQAADLEYRVER